MYCTTLPKKPYIEIAEIILEESDSVYELKKAAAKLGADAIIIVGPASIHTSSGWVAFGGPSSSQESGRKAIAIKYTDQDKTE